MEHRGEIIASVLAELGLKKKVLANRLKKHPNTITNWLSTAELPDELILKIGAVLRYDFSHKIPTLRRILVSASEIESPPEESGPTYMVASQQVPKTLDECQRAYRDLEVRFMDLQDKHIKVLSKLARVA